MGRKRYTAEQIIGMLRGAEVCLCQGQKVGEVCQGLGITQHLKGRQDRLFAVTW
jgi:hypothetical protein